MNAIKGIGLIVVLGALGVLAFAPAQPVYGQGPVDRRWLQDRTLLEGPGSQIGITARDLEPGEAERLKVQGGVYVDTVRAGSPAEKGGLRSADVVVEFDGERVRSLRQFTRLVRETPPDRQVAAVVMREGKRTELTVAPAAGGGDVLTFDSRQLRDQIAEMTSRIPFELDLQVSRRDGRLGVRVQELTPELAEYFGAKDGVLVASVTSDSAAARAGVRAGDVITAVNGRAVGSSGDLMRELRGVADGQVKLGIVRDKKESTLTATIDAQPERRARPVRPIRPIGATI